MNTPIVDFVKQYADSSALRLHMPGHKGTSFLGMESLDITEIEGADSLYEARGIIAESEANASSLFGAPTFYSTEGSSQCIRAMLYLACIHAQQKHGGRPLIAAGRNAHKTFLSAAALLDFDVLWLTAEDASYLSCSISADSLDSVLRNSKVLPAAVYLTSPDYLGNMVDIAAIARVCHSYNILLLIDNAHGAYLHFLPESRHPMDLGADICCDSAHKTLPVLTGGAYLHIAPVHTHLAAQAKNALSLFGSTSPSYLILQSLDAANAYLAHGYREKLSSFADTVQQLKEKLRLHGYALPRHAPNRDDLLKLTISVKPYGYTGYEMANYLLDFHIVCEFADPDFLVLMMTPETGTDGLNLLAEVLFRLPKKTAITEEPPVFSLPEQIMTVREAVFSPCEVIPAAESEGRILAGVSVGCPPAVPIVVSGERIHKDAVRAFRYYGMEQCTVVRLQQSKLQ